MPSGFGSPAVRKGIKALRFSERSLRKSASIGFIGSNLSTLQRGDLETVLVTPAGKADHYRVILVPSSGTLHSLDDGMRRFERRDDAFQPATEVERVQGLGVANGGVTNPL